MKLFSWSRKTPQQAVEMKDASFETVLRLLAASQGLTHSSVSPDTCMKSPTVQAIVRAISARLASTPVHVYKTETKNGREYKEKIPNHPVSLLLKKPNEWQSRYDYWQDAASCFVRHGRYIAKMAKSSNGKIHGLYPVNPSGVEIKQDQTTLGITFKRAGGEEWPFSKVHFVRGPSRDFFSGDSPVNDVATTIALEIAAEDFGASFFENGAVPLLMFKYMAGVKGFKTPEEEQQFINDFQAAFSGEKRHRAFLVPPGIENGDPIKIENDKAQFLQTRQHQRTVIAGAFGVPPQFVGDLSKGTYNNVEQQSEDFTLNVIMPVCSAFEAAMERDLLSDDDREKGYKVRFNLDAELRAAFIDRQNGLQIQYQNGVINANEWREIEGKPPRDDEGAETYHTTVQVQPNGAQQDDTDEQTDDQPRD